MKKQYLFLICTLFELHVHASYLKDIKNISGDQKASIGRMIKEAQDQQFSIGVSAGACA